MLDSRIGNLLIMNMNIIRATLIAMLLLFLPSSQTYAQVPGYAEILDPSGGEAIQGVYVIIGSASHPSFLAYQLSFTYSQNPSNAWFPLDERQEKPILESGLGLWDTTGISDGDYSLRLEVFLENETSIVAIVDGVRIRNQSTVETATPAPITAQITATERPPTRTPRPTPLAPVAVQGSLRVQRALIAGAIIGFMLFCSLGVYLFVRRRARQRWGMLQMRKIIRDQSRRRKSGDKP